MAELIKIKKEIISKDYSIDILLCSEEEFNKKTREGWVIFNTITEKGKLCYAA